MNRLYLGRAGHAAPRGRLAVHRNPEHFLRGKNPSEALAGGSAERWFVVGLCGLAFALRSYRIGSQALWADEASTVLGARNSLADLIPYALHDTFPPLHFMLLHILTRIAGESELATRLLSAAFGLLIVPAVYLTARRLGGAGAGMFAAGLTAISPYQVYFSQEVRGYTQLAAFVGLSTALFARLVSLDTRRFSRSVVAGYWLTTAAAIYTQYLAIGPIAVLWAGYLVARRDSVSRRRLLLMVAGVAVLMAPWGLLTLAAALGPDAGSPTAGIGNSPLAHILMIWRAGAVEVGRLPLGDAFSETLVRLPLGETLQVEPWLPVSLGAWALVLTGTVASSTGRRGSWLRVALLVAVVLPVGLSLVTALPTNRPQWSKYFIASSPALLTLLGLGADAIRRKLSPLVAIVLPAIATAVALPALLNLYSDPLYFRSDFRPELARLHRMSPATDVYIANPKEAFADLWYYYPGGLAYVPPPAGDPAVTLEPALASKTGAWLIKNQPVDFDPDGRTERWLAVNGYPTATWYPANMTFSYYLLPVPAPAELAGSGGPIFGGSVALDAWTVSVRPLANRSALALDVDWRIVSPPSPGLALHLALVDSEGRIWAQRDAVPGGGFRPSDTWRTGEQIHDRLGMLLPPGMPEGRYRLDLALYRPGGDRLVPSAGGDRARLGVINLPSLPAVTQDYDGRDGPSLTLGGGSTVLAASINGGAALPGDRRALVLDWVGGQREDDLLLIWRQDGKTLAVERRQLAGALPGILRRTIEWVRVPPDASGEVAAMVGSGQSFLEAGHFMVAARPRQYEPASYDHRLDLGLGDGIEIAGYRIERPACSDRSACQFALTLVWRATGHPVGHYKSFVHVLDYRGQIVTQVDQIPLAGRAPTAGWFPGEWLVDPQPEFRLPQGRYRLVAGLYDPDSGRRLVAPDGLDIHELGDVDVG